MITRRAQAAVRWILLAALGLAVLAAAGFIVLRLMRPSVIVTEAAQGPVVQAFYSTGTIEPEREYPIKSNTAGILTEVLVDKGDAVTEGQGLAVVSEPSLKYTLDKAQAELHEKLQRADEKSSPVLQEFDGRIQALTELTQIAQREVQRLTEVIEQRAASQADLDRALERVKQYWSEAESLKAQRAAKQLELGREVEVARSAVAIAQWNLDQQTLKSPIDGVVLDRPTSLGTRVAVNDRLMRIADVRPENLVMRAQVDEEDIARARIGQPVRMALYAFTGTPFLGHVSRIYDEADVERRTFEVDVRMAEKNEQLAPGMTGELAFILAEKQKATVIPSQAVQEGQAVWIVRGGRLVRTTPQIGITSVERTEIVSGLEPGDRIVISPIGSLSEGQRVGTRYIDPVAAAGLNKKEVEEQPFKAFD